MHHVIQLNDHSIRTQACEIAFDIYASHASHLPPCELSIAESLYYEVLHDLDLHLIAFGVPEYDDIITRENLEEDFIFSISQDWFRIYRMASLERPSRGGGFSCLRP